MKHNPKVVPFDRSAAYVRHRALKNLRDNNPVDALELMRHAVEYSPDNQEYLLDLAEMYCEMGLHEQSNRILLDMLAGRDAPAECYYGLALNQFGRNELESARQALSLYESLASDGEYLEDAGGLRAEMDFYDAMRKPMNRKVGRAEHISGRACDALKADDPERACRLFRRSLEMRPNQPEMRALYAMALRLCGDEAEALRQAGICARDPGESVRALCVAAQVFWLCGRRAEARSLADRAIAQHPAGVELRLMIFALSEMEMYEEAGDAVKAALREAPLDKALLHLRAVTLHRTGAPDSQAEAFWLRILRIDPEDSVARFYHDAASRGALNEVGCELTYEVPGAEFRRRMVCIADCLGRGLEYAVERWRTDREFRSLLIWAAGNGEESCGRAAVMIIASAGDPESESTLRELFYRGDVPVGVKLHALVFLRMRGARLKRILPPGMNARDGMLAEPEELLKELPVGERQLIRLAADVLEVECGVRAVSALAVLWCAYRDGSDGENDPLVCTQEAAAALAWNYLLRHGQKISVKRLSHIFMCKPRRMVFYARHMAAVLDRGGTAE